MGHNHPIQNPMTLTGDPMIVYRHLAQHGFSGFLAAVVEVRERRRLDDKLATELDFAARVRQQMDPDAIERVAAGLVIAAWRDQARHLSRRHPFHQSLRTSWEAAIDSVLATARDTLLGDFRGPRVSPAAVPGLLDILDATFASEVLAPDEVLDRRRPR